MLSLQNKIIVVGAGKWGINHIKTANSIQALVAVVDQDNNAIERARSVLQGDDIKFYSSLSRALENHVDACVVVATPPVSHFAVAQQAIQSKRHVLVEKPLCHKLSEAETLLKLAKDNQVCLMVDHLLRYSALHVRLLALIKSGFVGDVTRIKMTRMNFGTIRTQENVLWSFTPHDVSILLALCGDQVPTSVLCSGQKVVSSSIEDYVDVSLKFSNGVTAQIEASWLHPLKERRLIVYGTKGSLILNEAMPDTKAPKLHGFKWSAKRKSDGSAVAIEKSEQDILSTSSPHGSVDEQIHSKPPLQAAIEHFLDCAASKMSPITDGEEGVRVLRVLQAATASLEKEGVKVQLTPPLPGLNVFVHPTAIVEKGAVLGPGTKVWHFSHIMPGAKLGPKCNIGQNVYIGGKAILGRNVKVQNNVSVYDGVTMDDDVFLGPSCVFTNVKNPRSHVNRRNAYLSTRIGKGATIGANATIVCGINLGSYSFIGAGAVVTKDVPAHALVYGNPARIEGWMSVSGNRLQELVESTNNAKLFICNESKQIYRLYENGKDGSSGLVLEQDGAAS